MTLVTLTQDDAAYLVGDYAIHNNVWNKRSLRNGLDFTQTLKFDNSNVGGTLTFDWSWPAGNGSDVRAYPEIGWGDAPHYRGVEECHDYISKVRELTAFNVNVGVTPGAAADYRNVSFDLWLSSDALGTASTVTTEVMVWLDKNEVAPWGKKVGTLGSGDDRASIYYVPEGRPNSRPWDYIAVVYDQPHLQGDVDLKAILQSLAAQSLVSGKDYISGYRLGVEVDGGKGSLKFDHLSQTFATTTTMADIVKTGTAGNDVYNGLNGKDTLRGADGTDTINGGANSDTIEGGSGADKLNGGAGVDTIEYRRSTAGVYVDLQTGYVTGGHAKGDWTMNFENAVGSEYADTLHGSSGTNAMSGNGGSDTLDGRAGDDTLYGGTGNDKLTGGDGNDKLYGGDGSDRLIGAAGADQLSGGAAADVFVFLAGNSTLSQMDVITDFVIAQGDRLDISTIDANTLKGVVQDFVFIGASAFHGLAGELRTELAGSSTFVYGDTDGDKVADLAVQLTGALTLSVSAFVL